MLVRDATRADLDAIMAIYDHWIVHSTATFDLVPLDAAQREAWFARFALGEPLLVAEDADRIVGYAYYLPFRAKPGYAATRETTVYVAPDAHGRGIASALYDQLIARARADNIHVLIAGIADDNPSSAVLHRRFGFAPCGKLREAGHKFDRWVDIEFWQRIL